MAALGVAQTSARAPDATNAKVSVASIFSILDRKSKIDASIDEGITLPSVKGEIEFHHVSFKYPTRPDIQIFTDLCLHIQSGMVLMLSPLFRSPRVDCYNRQNYLISATISPSHQSTSVVCHYKP